MTVRKQISNILKSDIDQKTQILQIFNTLKEKGMYVERETIKFIFGSCSTLDKRLYNIVESTDF